MLTRLPDALRQPRRTEWVDANKPGHVIDSFLEGPVFDRAGNLYVTDIPYGRIFRIDAGARMAAGRRSTTAGPTAWRSIATAALWIADYRRGILRLDAASGAIETRARPPQQRVLQGRERPHLRRRRPPLLHRPGPDRPARSDRPRLPARRRTAGSICCSPMRPAPTASRSTADGKVLFVAVTRGNQVWRGPLLADGSISKIGAFHTFFGTSGPDGLARRRPTAAWWSRMRAWAAPSCSTRAARSRTSCAARLGRPSPTSPSGRAPRTSCMTESATGSVLEAELPAPGAALFSHRGLVRPGPHAGTGCCPPGPRTRPPSRSPARRRGRPSSGPGRS